MMVVHPGPKQLPSLFPVLMLALGFLHAHFDARGLVNEVNRGGDHATGHSDGHSEDKGSHG